jgi:hypothetical protein
VLEFSSDNNITTTTGENGLQLQHQKTDHTNDTYAFFWIKTPSSLVGDDQSFVEP